MLAKGLFSQPLAVNAASEPVTEPVDITSLDNMSQASAPVEERIYQITERLGPFADDTVAYEDETTVRQIAYSAQRTHNEGNYYNEQNADWGIIAATATDPFVRSAADYNQRWIAYMAQGPGSSTYGSTAVNTSWSNYSNWLLGINDGASIWPDHGGGWSGFESNFYSYAGWYVNVKKSGVWAVPHNEVP